MGLLLGMYTYAMIRSGTVVGHVHLCHDQEWVVGHVHLLLGMYTYAMIRSGAVVGHVHLCHDQEWDCCWTCTPMP